MILLGGIEEGKIMVRVYYKRRTYFHRKKGRHEGGREGKKEGRLSLNEEMKIKKNVLIFLCWLTISVNTIKFYSLK